MRLTFSLFHDVTSFDDKTIITPHCPTQTRPCLSLSLHSSDVLKSVNCAINDVPLESRDEIASNLVDDNVQLLKYSRRTPLTHDASLKLARNLCNARFKILILSKTWEILRIRPLTAAQSSVVHVSHDFCVCELQPQR